MMNNKVVYGWYASNIPFYIGIGTVKRSRKRTGRNSYCLRKRDKAERENCFEIRVLYSNLSWEEACKIECQLIQELGRIDLGTGILTNMTDGGDGVQGYKHTDKERRDSSNRHKGEKNPMYGRKRENSPRFGKTHTKQTKEKISKGMTGENHPMFGKQHTEETKNKQSEVQSGEKSHMYGKTLSKETILKLSKAKSGKNNPMYGKLSSRRRKVFVNGKQYRSLKDACEFLKISKSGLQGRLKSKNYPDYFYLENV